MRRNKKKKDKYSSPSEAYTSERDLPFDMEGYKNTLKQQEEKFKDYPRERDKHSKSANTPLEIQIQGINNYKPKSKRKKSIYSEDGEIIID